LVYSKLLGVQQHSGSVLKDTNYRNQNRFTVDLQMLRVSRETEKLETLN